ncbi:acyl carrier protein [Entomohabitans teleogrylli]|uniref:acyl carrier protein n=1 Tax=Entomohabitans teleogrylli TaxID=1384589 RepID=UPI00073D63F6|nr:acyl carrier protein [Entomohabitans teleogrylli]
MSQYAVIYEKVCEMICDAKDLERDEVNEKTPLSRLELDSLDYVELMVLAKREFNVTLSAEQFMQHPNMTLGELCQLISQETAD